MSQGLALESMKMSNPNIWKHKFVSKSYGLVDR